MTEQDAVEGLVKFGLPVLVTRPHEACGECILVRSVKKLEGRRAAVELEYPPEGIEAGFELTRDGADWVVERRSIVEHAQR